LFGFSLGALGFNRIDPVFQQGTTPRGLDSGLSQRYDRQGAGPIRAFGFRNFENFRIRVLAQCGWNGVINRV
jgi:hypothetical protein